MLIRRSFGPSARRDALVIICVFALALYFLHYSRTYDEPYHASPERQRNSQWAARIEHFPTNSTIPLPKGAPSKIPKIQHPFPPTPTLDSKTIARRVAVQQAFVRSWMGYREHAWMQDELSPISGGSRNHFGGWAATLVDSLDTLWIMGMKSEFEAAVLALNDIDFSTTDEEEINTFETTIRYLGGLLSAHDLTDGHYSILMEKALELGDMLYAAFDTPNRMPVTRWQWRKYLHGVPQEASKGTLVAEIGSLSLEFTRLSQISGDPKFFDAVQRIYDVLEREQPLTKLPGMWPVVVNAKDEDFTGDSGFSLGAMADSVYEYLPKQYMLLDGLSQQPRKLYEAALEAAKKELFFRPMTKGNHDILISGNTRANVLDQTELDPQFQHLVCFVGGMMGIASKIFKQPDDLITARKLTDGCIWAYRAMPSGMMPEVFHVVPCANASNCDWDEKKWHEGITARNEGVSEANIEENIKELKLVEGFTDISDRRYILRPEAIESVFILYRITGDESLRDEAWEMFQSIDKYTKTEHGNAALNDMTQMPPTKSDSMESFWTAETLKYFYLIFSAPDLVSLDDYVFNTEAHSFKRPKRR